GGRGLLGEGSCHDPHCLPQMMELLGCLPPLLFLALACGLDQLLYAMFSIIRHHSFVEYSFRSSHHLEVKVGGSSMLARLLRSTVGALNTSSQMVMESTNLQCLPEPHGMTRREYLVGSLPLGILVLLCLMQVYAFRLRRAIAAFYFPKREKKRVLFLYNKMLRQRLAFIALQRKRIVRRARRRQGLETPLAERCYRWCPFLRRFLRRRCMLCGLPETRRSQACPAPACCTVYCQPCWGDLGQVCFACSPGEGGLLSGDSESGEDYVL
uniref:DC-STAMP domain containing 1 n=1 Tax=Sphenodon punctatus TaxID=8508 RepID=A0A8D0GCH5_SPHPU